MTTARIEDGLIIAYPDECDIQRVLSIPGARRTQKRDPPQCKMACTLDNLYALREITAVFDGATQAALSEMERVARWTEKMKLDEDPKPLKPAPITGAVLYKHQVRAYNLALVQQTFAAFMDMGTGKSMTMVAVTGRRYLDGKIKRVLIVAPTSVCAVWPREYGQYADFPHRVAVLLGEKKRRIKALGELMASSPRGGTDPLRIAVINYESTWRLEDELAAFKPDMIICDESQRIKGHATNQSKAMHALGKLAKYRVILSGTPMQNDPRDFWSQYMFLNPGIFGANFYAFQRRYTIMGGPGNHMMLGTRNMDELTHKVHSVAYRVTKAECLDLPDKTYITLHTPMPERAVKAYKQVQKESYLQLEQGEITAPNVLVRLLRLQQMAGGFVTDDDGISQPLHTAKIDALDDVLTDYVLESGRKLVVFARFINEIEAIITLLDKRGIEHVDVWGAVPAGKRGELVERFQTDVQIKVFVGQIDACAEGITLTAADTVVYFSVNWNLAKYQQSQDRIHRIGQAMPCTYLHLVAPGTVDEMIIDALRRKEDLARSITDNWRTIFTK